MNNKGKKPVPNVKNNGATSNLSIVLPHFTMTISQAKDLLHAQAIQLPHPQQEISALMLDTRHVPVPGAAFFAIVGQRHNGHQFLHDAWNAGVRQFIISQEMDVNGFEDVNILLVEDTLLALQQIAAAHRQQFRIPIIGITGSNGKTIVKEWLYQVLSPGFRIVRSPKSYNSQVGVPLSVWDINETHELGIFEAGISQPDEMARLENIIRPDLGIFTNIGSAHSDGFASDQQKVAEKMQLFHRAQRLIYCTDAPLIHQEVERLREKNPAMDLFSWSQANHPAARFRVTTRPHNTHTVISCSGGEQNLEATIPFSDAASVENAVHCLIAGMALNAPAEQLTAGLEHLQPIEMRLEIKSGIEDSTLINDFYNNDLSSLQILLQMARQQSKGQKMTLILSDILQSGLPPDQLYQQVARQLTDIARFIGIGSEVTAIQPWLPAGIEIRFYPDTASFIGDVSRISWRNAFILLKGARPFEFEKIARRLEKKAHQTRLEINLNALIHNLKVYNGLLRPGVRTMVMVKAAAYGSGGAEVGRLLEFHKVHYLGVAYADEGIELRQAGVQLPILVLNPDTTGFDVFYRYQLEPEIFSLDILRQLTDYSGREKRMTIHLKLDTGMHRLGFEPADMDELTAVLRQHPNLRIASVFSHLSASDNPVFDDFTHQQARAFQDMYARIESVLDYKPLRHIVNTGGIARFPQYHFDMVRLGVGIYGVDSSGLQSRLQVVNVLKTTISQVKHIPAGDTVGYNRNSGLLTQPTTIATISIGYADGFLRSAGGGKHNVLINNQLAPTIGNICMDMTMIDVSHIPNVKAGDEVVIFGQKPSVEDLAKIMNTIPYEIFTNISDRVKRVYVQE